MLTRFTKCVLLLVVLGLSFPFSVQATNKFGIHVLESTDLESAQKLVNSNGGDWGWVTVVIRDDDLDFDKWQGFMNKCRRYHLVPIVRIGTHLENGIWVKPQKNQANAWAQFLDSLNWPVKKSYVIVFNEPNQAKEWGGEVNPEEYCFLWQEFYQALKEKNENFQVLNAGLDLAAPDSFQTMNADKFLTRLLAFKPDFLELLDGWVSHSYPNHGFLGKPEDSGRYSVRGYQWELDWLNENFGFNKDLPVFITETGWPKDEGYYYDQDTVAEYLKQTFIDVWLVDERIIAVTPFVLNYQQEIFDEFSWLDKQGNPYSQFEKIKSLKKKKWQPEIEDKTEVVSLSLPPFLLKGENFKGKIVLKNKGQLIWPADNEKIWQAQVSDGVSLTDLVIDKKTVVKPGEQVELYFWIKADLIGEQEIKWEDLTTCKITVVRNSLIKQAKLGLWERLFSLSKKGLNFLVSVV